MIEGHWRKWPSSEVPHSLMLTAGASFDVSNG